MDRAIVRMTICLAIGAVVAVALGAGALGIMSGWTAAAFLFVVWTWLQLGPMDPDQTKTHATREDPIHGLGTLIILVASLASLGGVLVLLTTARSKQSGLPVVAIVAVCAVFSAWTVVHTIYTLHYARLFHQAVALGNDHPVDFNTTIDQPDYQDFAYLSFTLGMTYQVSDTNISARTIRRTVLRQSLLSYLFSVVIVACTINLVLQLAA